MLGKILIFHAAAATFMIVAPIRVGAQLAPNAPADKPVAANKDQARRLEEAIAPLVEQARKTYSQARARFLAGLPRGETFFVTAKLADARRRTETVFIQVTKIAKGKITGHIASKIMLVSDYKEGDSYTLEESALVDWMISKPDGSEEGNLVGKFMDTYQTGDDGH